MTTNSVCFDIGVDRENMNAFGFRGIDDSGEFPILKFSCALLGVSIF